METRSVFALALPAFLLLSTFVFGLSFSHPLVNWLLFGLCLVLPTYAFVRAKHRKNKLLIGFVSIPGLAIFAVWAIVFLIFAGDLASGVNPINERIRTERIDDHRLSVFRSNGGATTRFGVSVWDETVLVPGINLVYARRVYSHLSCARRGDHSTCWRVSV